MRLPLSRLAWLLPLALLAGCGSRTTVVETPPESAEGMLGDTIDVSLEALLAKPRPELAAMADELTTKARLQENAVRAGQLTYTLLPELRPALAVPVFRDAQYYPKAGFSLPPYAGDGKKDAVLALHLARYGDREAAAKLVDPADDESRKRIDECRCERNYPVEWARVVGLLIQSAEVRLATGDLEGGTELVALHKQLQAVLDGTAARGPLGAALLSRGRKALTMAAAAWRSENKNALAKQAEGVVQAWGDVPAPKPALNLGSPRAQAEAVFGGSVQGHLLQAPSFARALDLADLPFPADGLDAVLACFDARGQLAEVVLAYRPKTSERFPEPGQLALLLENHGLAAKDEAPVKWLRQRTYPLGGASWEVSLPLRGNAVGGLACLRDPAKPRAVVELPRDFGALHLNRSFEQNRLLLAPEAQGETVQTNRPKVLAQLTNPLRDAKLGQASLQRDGKENVTAGLALGYALEQDRPPLFRLAVPLLAAWGPGRFDAADDAQGEFVTLTWEDTQTRCQLRLSNQGGGPTDLRVEDRRKGQDPAARAAAAAACDRSERLARLDKKKPWERLPRSLEWNAVPLGTPKKNLEGLLSQVDKDHQRAIPGGYTLAYDAPESGKPAYQATQLFLRLDDGGKVAEVRVRYQDGAGSPGTAVWTADMLKAWKASCGAPEVLPSPWAKVWEGLPPREAVPAPALYRWRDDVTVLTFQTDAFGAELAVRDCPRDHPDGAPLPPLEYLDRGIRNCTLGDAKDAVLRKWGVAKPQKGDDGAVLLTPGRDSAFEAVEAWFDMNNQFQRIRAHHRLAGDGSASEERLGTEVKKAWDQQFKRLGWPRRPDYTPQQVLQGLGWQDERTRFRIYWEKSDDGSPRLYSEWVELGGRQ